MLGPLLLPPLLALGGAFAGGWAGAFVGFAVGVFADGAVVVGAAVWARQIGSVLEPDEAWAMAPRPPLFRQLVEWVYRRALPGA